MLIQKGNFLLFKSWLAGLALLCAGHAWAAGVTGASGAPVTAAPDAVAAEFYGWYLDTLAADQDPLSDRYATFTDYVAAALTARLVERIGHGPPPASDYFIQADDYRQAWLRDVSAAVVRRDGATAQVRLTLGREARSRRTLRLDMVLEGGRWKVRDVALASEDVDKSSMERFGI